MAKSALAADSTRTFAAVEATMRELILVLTLLCVAGCGGGAGGAAAPRAEEEPPPTKTTPLTEAAEEILSTSGAPDAAFEAFAGEVVKAFREAADPQEAESAALEAVFNALETQIDARAFLDALRNAGDVLSLRFAEPPAERVTTTTLLPDVCPIDDELLETVVYYVNDLYVSLHEAIVTLASLETRARLRDPAIADRITWRVFFNRGTVTEDAPGDVAAWVGPWLGMRGPLPFGGSVRVREAQDRAHTRLGASLGSTYRPFESPDGYLDAIVRWQAIAEQVERFRALMRQDIRSGKTVVVVAHGNGNLLARLAVDGLSTDEVGDMKAAVGVVAVASPTTYPLRHLYGAFTHILLEGDVIRALEGVLPFTGSNALGVGAEGLRTRHAVFAHGMSHSYLQYTESRGPILESILDMHILLVNPRSGAGQGYLQVTLTWDVPGDQDLHVVEPDGTHVYWNNKIGASGELDRDDIPGTGPENYYVCSPSQLLEGDYAVYLNNYWGWEGTRCTVSLRAGAQVRSFTLVMGPPNGGAGLEPIFVITYDGAALAIR